MPALLRHRFTRRELLPFDLMDMAEAFQPIKQVKERAIARIVVWVEA